MHRTFIKEYPTSSSVFDLSQSNSSSNPSNFKPPLPILFLMVQAATRVGQPPVIPFVPKKMFRTSFGVELEYLAIPKSGRTQPGPIDPSAPTIVFFNGYMLRFSQWGFQMPRYTLQHGLNGFSDCNLVFFNNLGHGNTQMNGTRAHDYLHHCALAAYELVRALGIEGEILTVAHSMGGTISLEFQRLVADQVKAMAFVSPILSDPLRVFPHASLIEPRLVQLQALLELGPVASTLTKTLSVLASDFPLRFWHAMFTRRTGSTISPEAFAQNLRKALELDAHVFVTAFLSMVQTGDELGSRLGQINLPRRVILGQRDFITDRDQTERIVRGLSPDTSIVVLEDTTHWANSERPERVNRELRAFFDSVH